MEPVVGQPDPGQNHGRTCQAKLGHNGNRTAGADLHRFAAYHLLERFIQHPEGGCADVYLHWIAAMEEVDADLGPGGRHLGDRLLQPPGHLLVFLTRDQSQAHFGGGLSRDNRLGAFADKAHPLEDAPVPEAGEHLPGDLTPNEGFAVEG